MLNTIKILILMLTIVPLTIATNAWADRDSHNDGRSHHWHGFHAHANPDLTLVSGMDNIDTRVLVDPAPDTVSDPGPEVIYLPAPEPASVPVAPQPISSDADGNFVVNVPNNQGGYTPIRIQKFGNGFVGPQGEFYYPFPQITQLKAMYGV